MEIKVYLNPEFYSPSTYKDDYKPNKEQLEFIGTIEADNLEEAYKLTQNGYKSSIISNKRSISIGDVFKTDEGFFVIQWEGFRKLDWR